MLDFTLCVRDFPLSDLVPVFYFYPQEQDIGTGGVQALDGSLLSGIAGLKSKY